MFNSVIFNAFRNGIILNMKDVFNGDEDFTDDVTLVDGDFKVEITDFKPLNKYQKRKLIGNPNWDVELMSNEKIICTVPYLKMRKYYNEVIFRIQSFVSNLGYPTKATVEYGSGYVHTLITVYIPKETSAKERIEIWNDLTDKVWDYAKKNDYGFILDDLTIFVERGEL